MIDLPALLARWQYVLCPWCDEDIRECACDKEETMREALKSCPFCGQEENGGDGIGIYTMRHLLLSRETFSEIECRGCGVMLFGETDEDAREKWNRRTASEGKE